LASFLGSAFPGSAFAAGPVVIGSKKFTESVILGEIATQMARAGGVNVEQKKELGGTRVLYSALLRGEIDAYPEYSGTLRMEILKELDLSTDAQVAGALASHGLRLTAPLGFNNTYAVGMKEETANRLGIRTISDLSAHPELRFGFTNEFLDRGDGWPSLRAAYGLPQKDVRGLDHDLAYRALQSGGIDVTDLYSTDAEIPYYGLRVLEDDLRHFPEYNAVFLYRADLESKAPGAVRALQRLCGALNEETMRRLNSRVQIGKETEPAVAADFLRQQFGVESRPTRDTLPSRVAHRTREHLYLVGIALAAGILAALPLGILAFKKPRAGQVILAAVGVIQTIPALALLVFMIPLLGIAAPPAIAALFLYSLLPMVRNTHAGLRGIPPSLEESAEALGLPAQGRLFRIELPLASRSILAGIKTSAVITVGFATLGALIGAGGYGQPILTGIRLDDYGLILEGAVPAALLAVAVQVLFELAERVLIPRGLRLQRNR
jgi:osmoprotectant transport system permease protein